MAVLCWYFDTSVLADEDLFVRGLAGLPWDRRREQVMRFRTDQGRRLCLGAGMLAAWALKKAGADDLSITYGEQGKPALSGHPEIHFNLSHSGSMAVCAVSDRCVGADVEQVREARRNVAQRCFLPQESLWIEAAADPDRAFYRIWTRKESLLKRQGVGLARPMNSFCVLPGEESERDVVFAEWETGGHMICVCTEQGEKVRFLKWNPEW